jgi:hypothetical protein
MLHYEALRLLTLERTQQREREAQAERLALEARGRQHGLTRRLRLAAGLGRLAGRTAQARAGA